LATSASGVLFLTFDIKMLAFSTLIKVAATHILYFVDIGGLIPYQPIKTDAFKHRHKLF